MDSVYLMRFAMFSVSIVQQYENSPGAAPNLELGALQNILQKHVSHRVSEAWDGDLAC